MEEKGLKLCEQIGVSENLHILNTSIYGLNSDDPGRAPHTALKPKDGHVQVTYL